MRRGASCDAGWDSSLFTPFPTPLHPCSEARRLDIVESRCFGILGIARGGARSSCNFSPTAGLPIWCAADADAMPVGGHTLNRCRERDYNIASRAKKAALPRCLSFEFRNSKSVSCAPCRYARMIFWMGSWPSFSWALMCVLVGILYVHAKSVDARIQRESYRVVKVACGWKNFVNEVRITKFEIADSRWFPRIVQKCG